MVLAQILRTDMPAHRPLPNDTELARAIAVLARTQQDAVWDRTQAHVRHWKRREHVALRRVALPASFHRCLVGSVTPAA